MTPGVGGMSDRDLVLAFQAGDKAAYDELYRRHRDRVVRVCIRLLNNSTDAEEATQETFLKAFQALPRFNGQYQVGAWLARIATNVCVDQLRVKSRSHLVSLPTEVPITEQGPEDLLVGEDPRIDVAIKEIQPLHANALRMRAVDGMSHVEIAGRLRMSPAQVKALLHRARTSFKKAWDKAQGWLVVPIFGSRSLDRSDMPSTSSNVAALSAHVPALAEKAAATVVVVVVALTGMPSSPPTEVAVDPGAPATRAAGVDKSGDISPRPQGRVELETAIVATEPVVEATDTLLALPETVQATLEGSGHVPDDDDDTNGTGGSNDLIPPTAKETGKKAKELVAEILETIDE